MEQESQNLWRQKAERKQQRTKGRPYSFEFEEFERTGPEKTEAKTVGSLGELLPR